MNNPITRRSVLAGTGCLGAAGLLRVLPVWAQAPAVVPAGLPPVCLTMYYMSGNEAKFDRMQYRDRHVALLRNLYGDSLDRIELRTVPPRGHKPTMGHYQAGVAEPPVLAMESLWIRNLEAFAAATRNAGNKIAEDLAKITSARVTLQYEQLDLAQGEPRESIAQGTKCFSSLYPTKDAGTWDAEYYSKTVVPMLNEIYGPDVLRRVEVCKGVSAPGGGKPAITSAVHLYLKSEQAYMDAGMKGGMRLMGEGPKYTNIMPVAGMFDLYAVG